MRISKTKEIKVIQGNYDGQGWEDEAAYDKEEYSWIRHDLAEYRASSCGVPIAYRVITRRVPRED